jgi:pyruvate,water dikinase
MVQGIDVDLFRPDDELKKLAQLAVELEVDSPLAAGGAPDTVLSQIGQLPRGGDWLAAWETAKHPWFNFTSGTGFYASDRVWLDQLEIPLGYLRDYVARVRAGETIERPIEATAAERERITAEYRAALPDDQARAAFDEKLVLARLVFPYVENHNFYIEHWAMSAFWRKIRQLGRVLADAGFWDEAEDIFYLRRDEIGPVLFDYGNGWATGAGAIGPWHWPSEIERRKRIVAALASRPPRPAMNEPPEVVTEPFTIMLYGITTESVNKWLSGSEATDTLTGIAASSGRAAGVARVVHDTAELDEVREGEILVARITTPGWGPVFARIGATVTDIGGMMSHAAIVCREYGLPAVTGTGSATAVIRTGDRVLVDGSAGTVTLLDGTPEA